MLRVAYISTTSPAEKPKRMTAKEKLYADAIANMAKWRIKAKIKAKKMFAAEYEELRQLQEKIKRVNQ